jgi:hypothetical protein
MPDGGHRVVKHLVAQLSIAALVLLSALSADAQAPGMVRVRSRRTP